MGRPGFRCTSQENHNIRTHAQGGSPALPQIQVNQQLRYVGQVRCAARVRSAVEDLWISNYENMSRPGRYFLGFQLVWRPNRLEYNSQSGLECRSRAKYNYERCRGKRHIHAYKSSSVGLSVGIALVPNGQHRPNESQPIHNKPGFEGFHCPGSPGDRGVFRVLKSFGTRSRTRPSVSKL